MLGLPASTALGANPFVLLAQAATTAAATPAATQPATQPALVTSPSYLPPALLFVLIVAAAVGVILLLPGRLESPFRKMGGVVLLAAGLVFAALLAKAAAGMGAYFWIFAAIALIGALRVITHRKPVYSALYFVMTVMATAGLFVLMWAEFMAAALILIYAGAILVTYVFVIMLAAEAAPETSAAAGGTGTGAMHEQLAEHDAVSREPIIASAVGFALLGILLFVIFDHSTPLGDRNEAIAGTEAVVATAVAPSATQPAVFIPRGGTQALGDFLFNRQLVNLELAGLILTVAMVGAIVIARKRVIVPGGEQPIEAAGPTIIGPATPIDDNPHSIPVYGTDNPRQKEYPET